MRFAGRGLPAEPPGAGRGEVPRPDVAEAHGAEVAAGAGPGRGPLPPTLNQPRLPKGFANPIGRICSIPSYISSSYIPPLSIAGERLAFASDPHLRRPPRGDRHDRVATARCNIISCFHNPV